MTTVNMFEAKSNLSKLVQAVESGQEAEIVIARNGRPVARLVPLVEGLPDASKRLGIAAGQFEWTREMADAWEHESEAMWVEWLTEPVEPGQASSSAPKPNESVR